MSELPILDVRYIVVSDREPHEFRLQRNALRFLRREAKVTGAQYTVEFNDRVKPVNDLDDAIVHVKERIRKRIFGERVAIVASNLGKRLNKATIYVAAIRLQPADTPGVPNIDAVVAAVDEFWPDRRYAGICVCKPNSDHADCAAVDWFDTWDSMEAAARYFVANEATYGIKYVILGDRIWSATYGFNERPYGGAFHSHVHASVYGGIPGAAC